MSAQDQCYKFVSGSARGCDGTKPARRDRQPAWLWSGLFAATTKWSPSKRSN